MEKSKAFNKQNTALFIIAVLNLLVCSFLTLTCVPGQIPIELDIYENIATLGSKWWLSLNIVLPLILSILTLIFHKKEYVVFFLKALFVWTIYENMLSFSYFALTQEFTIGAAYELPLAATTFIPISVFLAVSAIKIKNIPYKSKFMGIRTKYTKSDEFIWKQTHYFARDVFFATGVILFFLNIPFLFVKLLYVPIILFIVAVITAMIIVNHQSKLMYKKLVAMQARKDKMNSKNNPDESAEPTKQNTEEKTEEKSEK